MGERAKHEVNGKLWYIYRERDTWDT